MRIHATYIGNQSPRCWVSKILLVQVGTLSSSHPSFGMSVFFLWRGGEGGGSCYWMLPPKASGNSKRVILKRLQ